MSGRTTVVLPDGRKVVGYRKTLIQRKSKPKKRWTQPPQWLVFGDLPRTMPFWMLPTGKFELVGGPSILLGGVVSVSGCDKDWCFQQLLDLVLGVDPQWCGRLRFTCKREAFEDQRAEVQHYEFQIEKNGKVYYGRGQASRQWQKPPWRQG